MPQKRFTSIEEWRLVEQARRREAESRNVGRGARPSADGGKLRVKVELASHADATAPRQCREVALVWLRDAMGRRLPRKALRHRSFTMGGDESACRAVRVADGRQDRWAAQFERRSAAGRATVTEVVVGGHEGRLPIVGVEVVDRSVVPTESVGQYPAEMLAAMAGRVPLLQRGRTLSHTPVVVDSAETMQGFQRMLTDPGREMPFAVVSVPPRVDDRPSRQPQWRALARALTGLAIVWVLPAAMTYRLSDLVGKPLSVFMGAWRFYRPGFDRRAAKTDHPLFLANRMDDERGVADVTRRFLSMAAGERMRSGSDSALPFDYRTLLRETADVVRGPTRLVALLRGSLRRRPTRRVEYELPTGEGAAAVGQLLRDGAPDGSRTAPASVREPIAPAASREAATSREAAAPATSRKAAATRPALSRAGDQVPLLRRKLRAATEKARARASRYERAKRRAAVAERERDRAQRRSEQLAGLVRSLGGNPDADTPFPTTWEEFAPWCDENLADGLVLAPSARRELRRARFEDVSLAARCLRWLAVEYRDARLRGGEPTLHGRVEGMAGGVFNRPCGGDAFDSSWDDRRHRVEWHLKSGANTRDPRRCLRVYYFWDEETRRVVVASMPAHRRSSVT